MPSLIRLRVIIPALVLLLAAVSTSFHVRAQRSRYAMLLGSIDPAKAFKLRMELDIDPTNGETVSGETTSPDAVRSLVSVLQQAAETERHTCVSIGRLRFHMSDGRTLNLSILPGHDPRFYEFRDATGDYRVNRADFLAAMSACGIQTDTLIPLDQRSAPVSSTSSHRQLP